jgi:phospholipid transport system substrate-binding protein
MMTSRRMLLAVPTALAVAALPLAPARAATPEAATAFVDQMLRDLLAIANGPEAQAAKRAALARVIGERVNVDAVARFCLGRFWRTATPPQQAEYTRLFRSVLFRNVSERVGEYQGVTYSLGRAAQRENDIAVSSTVNRPGQAPNRVDWVVDAEGPPLVIDVIAEGTSLRLTQRSDYASFLSRNNNSVQALIDALRQQAAAG